MPAEGFARDKKSNFLLSERRFVVFATKTERAKICEEIFHDKNLKDEAMMHSEMTDNHCSVLASKPFIQYASTLFTSSTTFAQFSIDSDSFISFFSLRDKTRALPEKMVAWGLSGNDIMGCFIDNFREIWWLLMIRVGFVREYKIIKMHFN